MKTGLFIIGLIFFFGSCFLLRYSLEKFDVDKHGLTVKMKIVSLPNSCLGAKLTYIVKFNYNGIMYDKQTRGDFCEKHYVGELVDMKWIDGIDTVMFPLESGLFELVSNILLGLFGLFSCIINGKRKSIY